MDARLDPAKYAGLSGLLEKSLETATIRRNKMLSVTGDFDRHARARPSGSTSTQKPAGSGARRTVNSLGDVYILNNSDNRDLTTSIRRGRPSLPWELFYLEVASLARANALPEKKEAAIHHFESWFREELGLHVGRSSIGQKLTPYYDRFVRAQPKIGGY